MSKRASGGRHFVSGYNERIFLAEEWIKYNHVENLKQKKASRTALLNVRIKQVS